MSVVARNESAVSEVKESVFPIQMLPAEMLQEIIDRLEMKDKLRMALVCRDWWNIVTTDRKCVYYIYAKYFLQNEYRPDPCDLMNFDLSNKNCILECFEQVTSFVCSDCSTLDDVDLEVISRIYPNLKRLEIQCSYATIFQGGDGRHFRLRHKCSTLLNDNDLRCLHLMKLERLELKGCTLTEDAIRHITSSPHLRKSLRHLALYATNSSMDQAMSHIFKLENLSYLSLDGNFGDKALVNLSSNCPPNLETLSLSHCYRTTDFGLHSLAKLVSLWRLSLNEFNFTKFCTKSLCDMLAISNITCLNLLECRLLNSDALLLGRLSSLSKLCLVECNIDDGFLAHLATNSHPKIGYLDISENSRVTYAGLLLVSKMPSLKSLLVGGCTGICKVLVPDTQLNFEHITSFRQRMANPLKGELYSTNCADKVVQ